MILIDRQVRTRCHAITTQEYKLAVVTVSARGLRTESCEVRAWF